MVPKHVRLLVLLGIIVAAVGLADAQVVHSGNDSPGSLLTITSGASNGVVIANDSDINPGGSFTWEFWLKVTEDATANGVVRIVATKWDGSNGVVVLVAGDGTDAKLAVWLNKPPIPGTADGGAGALKQNSWQHIAIHYRDRTGTANDTLTVYKNGVQTSFDEDVFGSVSNSEGLALGDDPGFDLSGDGTDVALGCQIDEFRVWSGSTANAGRRDQGEIQSSLHLASSVARGTDTLGARYAFDGNLNDSEGKTTATSAGVTTSQASTAPIGKSVSIDVSISGLVSFDGGGIDTDLDLDVASISVLTQLTVARIPAPLPDLTPSTPNISSVQYWTVSYEGSNANPVTETASLTADVIINLASEVGVGNPDDLRLLEASWKTGTESFTEVMNADDVQTDANQAVFTGVTVFSETSGQEHLVNIWALGGEADNPLPVELTSFGAQVRDGHVRLEWSTASELQNLGFHVYRSDSPNGPYVRLNHTTLSGLANSGVGKQYQWVDENIDSSVDTYYYYIEDVSFSGIATGSRIIPVRMKPEFGLNLQGSLIPTETALLQNYPNAFNPDTWIPFQLSESVDVTLSIYDVAGTLVRILALGQKASGYYLDKAHAAHWDGRNTSGEQVGSGIYYCSLRAGEFVAVQRMTLLK